MGSSTSRVHLLLLFFLGVTPTISSPLQSSTSIPTPPGLCANGADCLVIGIIVAIAAVVVLIMVVISSLIAYFYFRKRKRSHLIMDSKVFFVFVHAFKCEYVPVLFFVSHYISCVFVMYVCSCVCLHVCVCMYLPIKKIVVMSIVSFSMD